MILLEEEDITLEEVGVGDLSQVLIEVRNKDLTWPEEMSQITSTKGMRTQSRQGRGIIFGYLLNALISICYEDLLWKVVEFFSDNFGRWYCEMLFILYFHPYSLRRQRERNHWTEQPWQHLFPECSPAVLLQHVPSHYLLHQEYAPV